MVRHKRSAQAALRAHSHDSYARRSDLEAVWRIRVPRLRGGLRRDRRAGGERAAQEAIDHGITLFDNAESYGSRISEELLGKGLGAWRKEIVLVTKIGFRYEGNRLVDQCSSFDYVVASPEGCPRRLGTDWVDLLLIHCPDHNTPYRGADLGPGKPKHNGKIRHYGVSNFSPAMMDVCESAGHLAANPVGYTCSTGGWNRPCCRARSPTTSALWPTAP